MKKTMFSTAFHSALNEHVMEEEQKKITTYEEAFRKIKDATGVSDVNDVIHKFLTQDETHNNLVVMTKEAQARIDALNEEKAQAKAPWVHAELWTSLRVTCQRLAASARETSRNTS